MLTLNSTVIRKLQLRATPFILFIRSQNDGRKKCCFLNTHANVFFLTSEFNIFLVSRMNVKILIDWSVDKLAFQSMYGKLKKLWHHIKGWRKKKKFQKLTIREKEVPWESLTSHTISRSYRYKVNHILLFFFAFFLSPIFP